MAQPVFDDHPLEEYFRQAGEVAEDMPGTHADLPLDPSHDSEGAHDTIPESFQLPEFLSRAIQALNTFLSSSSTDSQFTERFKYDVISSSLLSTTLSGTPRRGAIPGRLPDEATGPPDKSSPGDPADPQNPEGPAGLDSLQVPTALVSVAIVAVSAEYYFVALFILAAALAIHQSAKSQASRANNMSSTVNSLNELISAGNVWDSAVNEAMMLVEKEERRPSAFYGPTSPQSPFSPLRVALQSSLHTTQNQCDNVRQLLSALTSPEQASQLSEMYAPSSPTGPSFLQLDPLHPRPMSDPVANWRKRTSSLPSETPINKRATWNGSYVALAQASKSSAGTRRSDKRRSELPLLFTPGPAAKGTMSAPPTPLPDGRLSDVQEEAEAADNDDDDLHHLPELSEEYFGMAALDLRKKRRSAGLSALRMSRPPSYSRQASHTMQPLTLHSASRFTLPQTSRNPLSLSALRLALHGALSAKRYSCSHLLALRFEDEDDSYWEDVRSIMALLTSTFSDASARLTEALDANEKKRVKDERPSESESPNLDAKVTPSQSMQEMAGFAPMPNHLTRFAVHVDSMSTAIDDARTHLEQCVAALRDPISKSTSADPFLDNDTPMPPTEHPALQAYDRLRKELGFALRECERGREHLLNTIMPPSSRTAHLTDGEDDADATPSLVPDTATSDGGASAGSLSLPAPPVLTILEPGNGLGLDVLHDDATEHLLMSASSQHLPPLGVDQVFEADSGAVGVFTRERSKMSREERIRLAKEQRRASSVRVRLSVAGQGEEEQEVKIGKWGPGGEVVQELKDVIWKVSEKKRRMSEQQVLKVESEEDAQTRRHSSAGALGEAVTLPQVSEVSAGAASAETNVDEFVDAAEDPTPTEATIAKVEFPSALLDTSRTTPLEFPISHPNAAMVDPSISIPEDDEDGVAGGLAYLDS